MRLYFDIETDGLLDTVSRCWIICAVDLDTGARHVFNSNGLGGGISAGLEFLSGADLLVGHNIIRYDLKALNQLFGWRPDPSTTLHDTLVLARLVSPNLKITDEALVAAGTLDSKLRGRDSLEAWGQRIGIHKAKYEGGFEAWNQEMEDYCVQDCVSGVALYRHLAVDALDQRSVDLEHSVAAICDLMEEAGWPFDEKAAGELYVRLVERRDELEQSLVDKFGEWQEVDRVLIPKRDNKRLGYKAGVEVTKHKTVVFNPKSRRHIEKKLRELGWVPAEFTPSGQAKLDEEILSTIEIPEAAQIIEYLLVTKRLGQVGDGDQGWLKVAKNGKIHAGYKTMGTVTGRAAHFRPNIAQTPANDAPYGEECRALFTVPKGWKLIGSDFEGLELRCLAHYLKNWDGGAYEKIVTEGDVHSYHAEMLGGVPRQLAKRFIYGWLYGAGQSLIAALLEVKPSKVKGILQSFMRRIRGLGALKQGVAAAAERGWLKGLDGRRIPVRSPHSAFNALLQSAGAVLCKTWLMDSHNALQAAGYRWGWDGDFVIVGWVHDELQIAVREGLEDEIGPIVVRCAQESGRRYGFKCRLDSKFVVGSSWKETH
jgi:DNA polymerase-1